MADRENLGHEPEETQDRRFAPVNRDSNARGRTVARTEAAERGADDREGVPDEGQTMPEREEGMARQEDEGGGPSTPGVDVGHPDSS